MDSKQGGCECNIFNMFTHAVIIILLLFIIWKLFDVEKMTSYTGYGLPMQVYTSGATQRRLGTEFTSTDEGSSDYVSNDEIMARQRFP